MAAPRKARSPRSPAKKKRAPRAREVAPPEVDDYVSKLRALKGVDPDDVALYADPNAHTSEVREYMPTGSLALDRLLGGGWPGGRIIELAAWEGVGKSTLIDQSIAAAQARGDVAALIDTEGARDPRYMRRLGVDLEKLMLFRASTVEGAFTAIENTLRLQEEWQEKLAKSGQRPPAVMIFWDSLAGTPTKAESEGEADDRFVAEAAKVVRLGMRRLMARLPRLRATVVFANQFYQGIGAFSSLNTYGGGGVRYGASVRLWLTRKESIRVGTEIVGHVVQAKLKKTKVGWPNPPVTLGLVYGPGFHDPYSLWEWGKGVGAGGDHRWVTQRGSWGYLMLPDGRYEAYQRGFLGFADALKKHPEIAEQMRAQYVAEATKEEGTDGEETPADNDA